MQLQASLAKYKAQGLGVVAISYDSVDVLQSFTQRMNISYPMLSDSDSRVIRAFGILNESVPKNSAQFGIPHPGMYIVDSNRKIVAKYFEEDYRERFTPDTIITRQFGGTGANQTEIKTEHLILSMSVSQETARPGNRVTVSAEITLPPKMHIYAPGVKGYRPTVLNVDASPDIAVHPTQFPQSKVLLLPAIKERVPVYEKRVRITRDVTVAAVTKATKLDIQGRFDYQACDDQICYIPKSIPFTLTIQVDAFDRQRVPEPMRRKAPPPGENGGSISFEGIRQVHITASTVAQTEVFPRP